MLSVLVQVLASFVSGKPARSVLETDDCSRVCALCCQWKLNMGRWRKWMIIAVFAPCVVQEVSVVPVRADGSLKSPLSRLLSDTAKQQLLQMAQANAGDLIFITAGPRENVVRICLHFVPHPHRFIYSC